MKTCPEMPDLLDHLEGRADHASHVAVCEPCASALSDLRSVLRVELANVAVPALDVERALESVHARARRACSSLAWFIPLLGGGRGGALLLAPGAADLGSQVRRATDSGHWTRCVGPSCDGHSGR